MTEEEKEAIEEIKKALRLAENIDNITTTIRNEYAEIIVELIKKQQKEIECLNVIHESYKEMIEENNYISKDKIRELINKRNAGIGYTSLECIEDIEKLLEE